MHSSTILLLVIGVLGGAKLGLYPISILFGDGPIMEFFQLLWTADAILIHCIQSLGLDEVTSCRYCLTHWFFCSERLSVCGWNAGDRF
jgi:hypothetical protein